MILHPTSLSVYKVADFVYDIGRSGPNHSVKDPTGLSDFQHSLHNHLVGLNRYREVGKTSQVQNHIGSYIA